MLTTVLLVRRLCHHAGEVRLAARGQRALSVLIFILPSLSAVSRQGVVSAAGLVRCLLLASRLSCMATLGAAIRRQATPTPPSAVHPISPFDYTEWLPSLEFNRWRSDGCGAAWPSPKAIKWLFPTYFIYYFTISHVPAHHTLGRVRKPRRHWHWCRRWIVDADGGYL